MATFETEMEQQRTRAREARQSSQSMQVQSDVLKNINTESQFVGYETTEYQTILTDLIYNGKTVTSAEAGETVYFILKRNTILCSKWWTSCR